MVRLRYFCALLCAVASAGASFQPANPPRLSYSTYASPQIGTVTDLAVDSTGYAYVAGVYSGCAFLTKLNQSGSAAVWSVCLPVGQINAVALDGQGYIYAAGSTRDQQSSISTVMKLSPDAQQSIYSTSVGGTEITTLAVDHAGNVYAGGWADPTFRPTSGAYLIRGGQSFALKLDSTGSIKYATYLDFLHVVSFPSTISIAVDSQGQLWAVGVVCPSVAASESG